MTTPPGERSVIPRVDLVERALPLLPAGSGVRQAFIAQAAHFWYLIVTYLTGLMLRNKYRRVVVTAETIYVLDSTKRVRRCDPPARW